MPLSYSTQRSPALVSCWISLVLAPSFLIIDKDLLVHAEPTIGYHICKATDSTPSYGGVLYDCAKSFNNDCPHEEFEMCESWCHTSEGCKFEYDCTAAFVANTPQECTDGTIADPASEPGCTAGCDSEWGCKLSEDAETCSLAGGSSGQSSGGAETGNEAAGSEHAASSKDTVSSGVLARMSFPSAVFFVILGALLQA
eukprot:gnl/TRDRNA2_/TRDRNA2_201640_c0_seq1.p1 gnl/TRDRNA2_/TRDRNA2_201640_c0~~gnl/TRDRNA2_/TRDRNA2_201640_c0_seq1.p1  ORF type:complete len:198 (+),score=34.15 gnl/TRDRNA2_/TRDRNA2_201640_c0_seq1:77-670(+)